MDLTKRKAIVAVWILFNGLATAQSSTGSMSAMNSSSAAATMTASSATMASASMNASTTVSNASTLTTAMSGLSIEDMWDLLVGPVQIANITTTVSPTPIPSSELIPPPPIYYSPFPMGAQSPGLMKNESWAFPANFSWGVASAAYQVEGAVKAEGRGPTIWDVLEHRVTDFVTDNFTGDVADNHYYLYKQDIARIAALGVPYYSFSVAWSRILPFGRGPVNEQGLAHYDDMIDTCLQYNVTPIVTLFHWDLPLYLQNLYGGWLSEDIVDDFVNYAQIAFDRWGDKVKHWFTVNEPSVFCSDYPLPVGYFRNSSAIPDKQQPYFCGQSVLLAHSKAYRLGKSMNISGTISYKNNGGFKIPLTNSSADAQAVQRAWDFNEGWWSDPIYGNGSYNANLDAYISQFLRPLTDQEKSDLAGSADIYAHDGYTSQFYYAPDAGIEACVNNDTNPLYPGCFNSSYTYSAQDGGWNVGPAADPGSPWLHKATDWVPALLHYIQDTWNPREGIVVSEFGFSEPFEFYKTIEADILFDPIRSAYYHDYLHGILMAINEGVNVVGCIAWAILDNLEWSQGYSVKFGLQYVNFTTQERAYKASFFEFVNMFKTYQYNTSTNAY